MTLRALLSIFAVLAANSALGVDIRWRGGTGNNFGTIANWQLPPGATEESERRIPGPNDRALISSPETVEVTAVTSITGLEFTGGGTLKVTELLNVAGTVAGQTSVITGTLVVEDGGEARFGREVVFNGEVQVARGTLSCGKATFKESVSMFGAVPVSIADTILSVGLEPGASVIEKNLRFDGILTSLSKILGHITVRGEVIWGDSAVDWSGILRLESAADSKPAFRVETGSSDEERWTNGEIQFGDSAEMILGRDRVMASAIVFEETSLGTIKGEGTEALRIQGPVTARGPSGDEALELAGPMRFEKTATLELASGNIDLFGRAGSVEQIEFADQSRLVAKVDFITEGFVVDDSALVLFEPPAGTSVVSMLLEMQTAGQAGRLDFRNGQLRAQTGRAEIVIGAAQLLVGEKRAGFAGTPLVRIDADVFNNGTITFAANPAEPAFRPICTGLWMNFGSFLGGIIHFTAGSGLDEEGDLILVSDGGIEIVNRANAVGDGGSTVTHVAATLINDGGLVVVAEDATLQLKDGENFNGGKIDMGEGSALQIVGVGRRDAVTYSLDNGTSFKVVDPGGLFNLRDSGEFATKAGVAIRLVGSGSAFPDSPSGLRVEKPLTIEHMKLGGQAATQPRFVGGAGITGPALTITKTLEWHGGDFFGNGTFGLKGTQSIEMLPGSALVVNSTPENPGSFCGLASGAIFNFHGQGTINTPFGFLIRGGSEFINHPDGALLYTGESLTTIINTAGSSGTFINRGTLRKNGLGRLSFNDNFRHEGTLIIEEGEAQAGTSQTFFGGAVQVSLSARFEAFGGTFRDVAVAGALKLNNQTTFGGDSSVDILQVGAPEQTGDILKSEPNTVLTVKRGLNWFGGNVNVDPTGTINLGPESFSVIRNDNPNGFFTFFKTGVINNEGEVTYIANTPARVIGNINATWNNKPGSRFIIDGEGNVFQADFGGIRPVTFNNEGEVKRAAGAEGDVFWHPKTFNLEPGKFVLGNRAGAARAASGRKSRTAKAAPLDIIFVTHDMIVRGGEFSVHDLEIEYRAGYEQSGGVASFTGRARPTWKKVPKLTGGEIKLLDDSVGGFDESATLAGTAGILIGVDALLSVFTPGLTLTEEATLEGAGDLLGNVVVNGGAVAPGNNDGLPPAPGRLRIDGTCVFGPGGELIINVPINQATPAIVELQVTEQLTFGGKLTVVSAGGAFGITEPFVRVATFASRLGEFTAFDGLNLGDGKRFDPDFRGANEFGLQVVSGGDGADLELSVLDAPTAVEAGKELSLRLQVVNRGPSGASQTSLDVTLPSGVQFVSSEAAFVLKDDGKIVGFNLGALNSGDTNVVALRLRAAATAGLMTIPAIASSLQTDPAPVNNAISARIVALDANGVRVGAVSTSPDGLELRLSVATVDGVRYVLERSADLREWTPIAEVLGDGAEKTLSGSIAGEIGFFRLSAQ